MNFPESMPPHLVAQRDQIQSICRETVAVAAQEERGIARLFGAIEQDLNGDDDRTAVLAKFAFLGLTYALESYVETLQAEKEEGP